MPRSLPLKRRPKKKRSRAGRVAFAAGRVAKATVPVARATAPVARAALAVRAAKAAAPKGGRRSRKPLLLLAALGVGVAALVAKRRSDDEALPDMTPAGPTPPQETATPPNGDRTEAL